MTRSRRETFVIDIETCSVQQTSIETSRHTVALTGCFIHPKRLLGVPATIYVVGSRERRCDARRGHLVVAATAKERGRWRIWTEAPPTMLQEIAQACAEGQFDVAISVGEGFARNRGAPQDIELYNRETYTRQCSGPSNAPREATER